MEEIIDKLDFIKINNFCCAKGMLRMRIYATDWKRIFAKDPSYKKLFSKIYKALLKLNNKKTT